MREGGAEPHRGAAMNELRIWLNGKLVPQAEAVLPVDSAAVFYGTNVFEGLRAYWNEADEELYAFRLQEHFTRLRESMKMMRFTVPYSDVDLYEAVREVLRGNAIREDADILESITRATRIEEICPTALGLDVDEREIDRTELYVAEEAFFCGSGYEITPIVSIDRFPLGDGEVGPITRRVLKAYMEVVRGVDKRYAEWRTPTYRAVTV